MEISGTHALVTGASRGLGRAVAIALAQAGADAVALVARDAALLQETAEAVQQAGARAIILSCDVRHAKAVTDAVAQAVSDMGSIDLVINNAGVGAHKIFQEQSAEEADFIIDVNIRGVLNIMRAVTPQMSQQGGIILNVASVLGKIPLGGHSVYTASKAAVVYLSRVARRELKGTGIRLLCFCPGLIDTDFQSDRREQMARIPKFILRPPERVAQDMIRMVRRETKESFGQVGYRVVHFFYRLLAG